MRRSRRALAAACAAGLAAAAGGCARAALPRFCRAYPPPPAAGQWQSQRVAYASGRLAYTTDEQGNRIPDFSYAGYRYGAEPLPRAAAVERLAPAPGDATARIQQAIDRVGARPPDRDGMRGALLLAPGRYEIHGTLRIPHSGVVLRGSGDGGDPRVDTILLAKGDDPPHRTVVVAGSGDDAWPEAEPRAEIVTPRVPLGAMRFEVAEASGFAVGDVIVIRRPSTQAWIDALGGGGAVNEAPWRAGALDVVFKRRITAIAGRTIAIDAPVYDHLDAGLARASIARCTARPARRLGVERLRIDIETAGGDDERHAWNGVGVVGAEDAWVSEVTVLHFAYAGVVLNGALRVTVERCRALDPVAVRTGGRMYNLAANERTQLALFTHCEVADARHGMISNGTSSVSGVVFHRIQATRGGGSEGHRRWSQALLFDNVVERDSGQILLINRGDYGTSHGWGAVHSVIWRYNSELVVQQPPLGQNYGVSDAGTLRSSFYFPGPPGHTELKAGRLVPESLYEAQLCERLSR